MASISERTSERRLWTGLSDRDVRPSSLNAFPWRLVLLSDSHLVCKCGLMAHTDKISKISDALRPVFERYGIIRAIVFGSLARNEDTRRSDLDLILVQDTEKRFLDRYDGLLRDVVEHVPELGVDLLIYTPSEIESMKTGPFIRKALEDGVVIYDSER